MNGQLSFEIDLEVSQDRVIPALRSRIRNLLVCGDSDQIHQLLEIRNEYAVSACETWYELNRNFLGNLGNFGDSENVLRKGQELERQTESLISALLYQSQKHD